TIQTIRGGSQDFLFLCLESRRVSQSNGRSLSFFAAIGGVCVCRVQRNLARQRTAKDSRIPGLFAEPHPQNETKSRFAAAAEGGMPQLMTPPPHSAVEPVTEIFHGVSVTDPYRWLEDQDSAQTRAWIEEQTRYARAYLESIPGRDVIRKRIREFLA